MINIKIQSQNGSYVNVLVLVLVISFIISTSTEHMT